MGYRSEVVIVLTRNGLSELFKAIPDTMKQIVERADTFTQKGDDFCFSWDYIKWYPEYYSEIGAFTNALYDLNHNDFHFLRIGEDREDIEERGEHYNNNFETHIVRSINRDDTNSKEVDLSLFL